MNLSAKQKEALIYFMAWGEEHTDNQGRRQYPGQNRMASFYGPWTIEALIKKEYITILSDGTVASVKAEKWWAEYKRSIRRYVVKLDKE